MELVETTIAGRLQRFRSYSVWNVLPSRRYSTPVLSANTGESDVGGDGDDEKGCS
jgi:hypothetical protein